MSRSLGVCVLSNLVCSAVGRIDAFSLVCRVSRGIVASVEPAGALFIGEVEVLRDLPLMNCIEYNYCDILYPLCECPCLRRQTVLE